nr:MAG: polyprotein [Picornaviridae sp.]
MAMDLLISTSNTNNSETKNESGVNHQPPRPIRCFYQNGESQPEDNTPLQAQEEDKLQQRLPFENSTAETSLSAASLPYTPSHLDQWATQSGLSMDIPKIVSIFEWNTSQNNGALLTTAEQGNTAAVVAVPATNPVLLPYHLVTNNAIGDGVGNQTGSNYPFALMFQTHGLYQSGFHVELSVNGTQFHSGSLMLVAVPVPHLWLAPQTSTGMASATNYSVMELTNIAQYGIFPSARLLPRSASSVTLDLPYVGQNRALATAAMDIQWFVFVMVETKLSIPTGGSPTLTVVLKIAPRNARFFAPRRQFAVPPRLGTLRNLPSTATPANYQWGIIPTGEAAFNNLSPRASGPLVRNLPNPASDYMVPPTEDFRSVLSIPTLLAVTNVASSAQPGQILFQVPVAPLAQPVTTPYTGGSLNTVLTGRPYLSSLSRYFTHWTGSINYTLEFTGPAVASARILVAFQPADFRPRKTGTNADDVIMYGSVIQTLTQGPHMIWDLSNSTSATLTCPYAVASPWSPIMPVQDGLSVTSNASSGTLYVVLLSQIMTPTVIAPTNAILLHISAGSDFKLRMPAPVPVSEVPMYNGVLDQGPEESNLVMGSSFVSVDGDTNLARFFSQSRFYGTFSADSGSNTTGSRATIPLTFTTYAPTSLSAAKMNPFRLFTSLFTFIRADIRVTISVPFSADVVVGYRPPGVTPTVYGNSAAVGGSQDPRNIGDILNGGATVFSTRASNMGIEVTIPFSSFADYFQTANNRLQQSDLGYVANESQFDPCSFGTLIVAARVGNTSFTNISIFVALDNASFYLPRPFPPLANPTAPTSLLPNPESFSWDEIPDDDEMPELEEGEERMEIQNQSEYQSPRQCEKCKEWMIGKFCWSCGTTGGHSVVCKRCHFGWVVKDNLCAGCYRIVRGRASYEAPFERHCNGKQRWECQCDECKVWIDSMVDMFEEGYELDDGGFIEFHLRLYGFLRMNVQVAEYLGWNIEELAEERCGWSVESLLDEIERTEEILADERLMDLEELPASYPEGPDYEGQWIEGEFYRSFFPVEKNSPFPWHENPFSRALLVYDPSRLCRFYHFLWNDTRQITWLSLNGKHLEALEMARNHPCRRIVIPMKIAAEFVKVTNDAECRRSSCFLERDLSEVRAIAMTNTILASQLFRSALRRVSYRRLTSWEETEVKKTMRFLISLEEDSDDDFFQDDEVHCEYEAPLGTLPAPPGPPGVRINTQVVATVAANNGVVVSQDDGEEVDDEPPETPYVYRVNRGIYNHWGLAFKGQAISLQQQGMGAVVALTNYDLEKAEKVEEVGMAEWFRAVVMLGQEFEDYNIQNNCTHFVEVITGKSYTNTGTWLLAGLGAAAIATAFIFQSPKAGSVAMRLKTLETGCEPKKTTRWARILKSLPRHRVHVFRRTMFFGKREQLPRRIFQNPIYNAPINITLSNPRVEQTANTSAVALQQTLQTYNEMAPQISAAVTAAAAALQDTSMKAGDFVDKLEALVSSTTDFLPKMASTTAETASSIFGDVARNIGSMILKIIGYTLIIFGNPNPATVAGVISLMAAEALSSRFLRQKIKDLATSLSHKLQSLFTSCFGLSVCADDPEIFEDIPFNKTWNEYMQERVNYEAPEPSMTQSFNQTVLAMKNIDWIIQKVKELIEFTINKLRGKKEKNPEGWLKSRADYMVKLYDDSVEVGSCQNVNQDLLKKRMDETSEMLAFAVNNRLGQPAALLSKTLSNYRQAQRKLNAAAYHDRPEPLVVYIHGGPGCGKSVLSNLIASAYCKRMGLPFSTSVFTTPPGSEFFDGYTGQPVHIIDDFCQNTTGEDVKLFCQMVSTTRFSPPMAALEEKGVNYCSKLIIATSNLATPQSNEVRIPAALERRCHIRVKTSLHPAFTTPSGTLDMVAAFKELGPAKSDDFKVDCPYLNGAAVACSVRAGGDRHSEKLSVYELMDVIYDELERRDSCQDLFRNVCYQAPQPGDSRCYEEGVIPTLCTHQDHDARNCRRIFFRKGDDVWHRDFESHAEMRDFMDAYHLGKLPKAKEIRPCPCQDPHCGKLLFISEGSATTFDFRSKSAMDFFLFNHGGSFKLFDPTPKDFVPTVKPVKQESIEEIKKSLTKLQKSCLVSFGITALGALSTLIGALIWLVRRNRNRSEAPYAGMPGVGRPQRQNHPRPIPTRNIKYEGQNLPQIYPKIEKNTFSIGFRRSGKQLFSLSGLGIAGRVAIGNYHGFSRADQVMIYGKIYDVEALNPTRILRNGHPTDLCVFTLPDGNEFKNITRFFLSNKDRIPRADCVLISRAEKMVCNFWARNVSGKRTVVVDAKDTHEEDTHHNIICYDIPSMPGMCGSPLLSTNSAREVVLGIHFAGTGSVGMAVPIYIEDFKSFLEANLKPIPHPGKPTHVARKSDLKPSPVHGIFPVTHGPAALTKNDKRLNEGVDLDEVMFSKHSPDHPGWPTLEPAMSYVVKDLMHKLGFHPSEKIEMWTLEQAINGDGVMDGIMMNQSPGYPYNTMGRSRRSFFVWNNNRWEPTDELRKEVERALDKPDQFYFSTFLKDELRPLSKVVAGKTRLVDGDSLPRALAYRMVFGPMFERMLARHGPEIHSAVGCNPETFWTEIFHKMGPATYPYVFDLDYSCFDSTEPAVSFRLMAKYLKPYFKIDVTPFFEALAVSKHVYEGYAYEMEGGMTSGCVGTSMFNCINNSAYIVSALLKLKINPEEVAWICYGDDVIISTHEKALSRKIAHFYTENTNLVVTPASKSGEFPETSTIYDVTFLKRFFQPDSNYPDLIHPYMPLDHLKQSVMWCTDGPFQAKLDSLCFLAFHAGRKDYEDFVNAIDGKAREKGLNFSFKSFEFLMSQWYANFM